MDFASKSGMCVHGIMGSTQAPPYDGPEQQISLTVSLN